jgi:pimeloyl-ACP methyl ester carboxylesterase
MNRITTFLLMLLLLCSYLPAGAADSTYTETQVTQHTATGDIEGTLILPLAGKKKMLVALIIAGSGPTDRNGNTPLISGANNSLLYLAQGLAAKGIASLRYDKRGIGKSRSAFKKEADLRIDNYIDDARGWLQLLRNDPRFGTITVIGHSEGALIGLVAAKEADRYISIAGAGFPAGELLKKQLAGIPDSMVRQQAFIALDSLREGHTVQRAPLSLLSLFRPSIQPYMISWLRLDPRRLIGELKIPVLIVQGDNDVQVSVEDAQSLKSAAPKAQLLLVPGMNHVLKVVPARDKMENVKTYSDPTLPVAPLLLDAVTAFILKK